MKRSSTAINLIIPILAISISIRPVFSFSTLITFDVDGTLVSSSPGWEQGAHGRSFVHAVDTILGGDELATTTTTTTTTASKKRTIPELLEKHEFHGSTDGLILLRLARKMFGSSFDNDVASSKVDDMMDEMFRFVSDCDEQEVSRGIAPLPGVLDTLKTLASMPIMTDDANTNANKVACGLVTGNVEGIARLKMRAMGIHGTNALTPLFQPQGGRVWEGIEDDYRFLGGFGSDYCSACIDDPERNYLDRGEQLAICVRRCLDLSSSGGEEDEEASSSSSSSLENRNELKKVIHVGDAPADILAAKSYVDHPSKPPGLCVSVVGVATGSFSAQELRDLCGDRVPGVWEPVVLDQGLGVGDEEVFLKACGLM